MSQKSIEIYNEYTSETKIFALDMTRLVQSISVNAVNAHTGEPITQLIEIGPWGIRRNSNAKMRLVSEGYDSSIIDWDNFGRININE